MDNLEGSYRGRIFLNYKLKGLIIFSTSKVCEIYILHYGTYITVVLEFKGDLPHCFQLKLFKSV